jgi:hypothetical protein
LPSFSATSKNALYNDTLPGDVTVCTVFFGVADPLYHNDGPPVLWGTLISGGLHGGHETCYTSREEAIVGHQAALKLARNANDQLIPIMNYERWMTENIAIPENDNLPEIMWRHRHIDQSNSSYLERRLTAALARLGKTIEERHASDHPAPEKRR